VDADRLIEITDSAAERDRSELRDRMYEYNSHRTGYRDGRSLCCFLRDESGRLVAGLDGFTWGGYARIEYLWVDESLRGRGLGRRLLAAAEREAAARGCETVVVDTHEFQAPELYPKLGYELVGTTHDTPIGYRQLLYQKRLRVSKERNRSSRTTPDS
jgi:GNAT superfamily N-acetyltransferase